MRGAIGVVELDQIADLNDLKRRFVEEGVWVRPFRNIVYLTPALTIDEADLTMLTDAIGASSARGSDDAYSVLRDLSGHHRPRRTGPERQALSFLDLDVMPGDIMINRENLHIHISVLYSLGASVVLALLFWCWRR